MRRANHLEASGHRLAVAACGLGATPAHVNQIGTLKGKTQLRADDEPYVILKPDQRPGPLQWLQLGQRGSVLLPARTIDNETD